MVRVKIPCRNITGFIRKRIDLFSGFQQCFKVCFDRLQNLFGRETIPVFLLDGGIVEVVLHLCKRLGSLLKNSFSHIIEQAEKVIIELLGHFVNAEELQTTHIPVVVVKFYIDHVQVREVAVHG
ncbi:MAG: hypothetical protein BWY82_02586 [Verrucomicrobia bacterium ADurb.Bin474]|nr:MAG: hypothetical protein BWY82_02586 [Verrucomicrobia bacterium ADurb.Bin474]